MSLSQIELVWVRVRVEWECFWVNPREDNKLSGSKMAVSGYNKAEFKMSAIIKYSQNEWVKFICANSGERSVSEFFFSNGGNQSWQVWVSLRGKIKMAESKMAAIIKLRENEWVWARLNLFGSELKRSESVFEWIWEKITRCLNPRL